MTGRIPMRLQYVFLMMFGGGFMRGRKRAPMPRPLNQGEQAQVHALLAAIEAKTTPERFQAWLAEQEQGKQAAADLARAIWQEFWQKYEQMPVQDRAGMEIQLRAYIAQAKPAQVRIVLEHAPAHIRQEFEGR